MRSRVLTCSVLRYLFRLSVHSCIHHSLECFVMCLFLAWEYHALLKMFASHWTVVSRFSLDAIFEVSRVSMLSVIALIKFSSSLLSLHMDQKKLSMLVSLIPTSIMRGTWSEGLCNSGWKECWPKPRLLGLMKTKSITELVSHRLSINLVGPGLKEGERSKPRLLAKVNKSLV